MVTRRALCFIAALTTAAALSACGGGGGGGGDGAASDAPSAASAERPTTTTRIQIEAPTPNQVTGPDVVARITLIGGRVVQRTTGKLTPDEGHIHVTVDGRLVSMTYQNEQEIKGLTPGPHSITAEFVAVDHAPFKNRPKAAVLFEVKVP